MGRFWIYIISPVSKGGDVAFRSIVARTDLSLVLVKAGLHRSLAVARVVAAALREAGFESFVYPAINLRFVLGVLGLFHATRTKT